MHPKMRLLLLLVAALLAQPAAAGEVYKWKDEQGRIHYSDTPPAHQPSNRLEGIRKGSEASAEQARKALADKLNESQMHRQQTQEAEDKQRAAEEEKRKRAEACRKAQERLAILQQRGVVAQIDAQGQRKTLSDAERQAAISQTQQRVTETCQ